METENNINETENNPDSSSDTMQPEASTGTSVENESSDNDSAESGIDTSGTVSDSSGDNQDKDTTDRLDEDMSIQSPEDKENETSADTVSGNSIGGSSDGQYSGSVDYELFEDINEALSIIRSENAEYYEESLLIQKNNQIEVKHISYLSEYAILFMAVIGFFLVMHVGGKMVSYFWERMR